MSESGLHKKTSSKRFLSLYDSLSLCQKAAPSKSLLFDKVNDKMDFVLARIKETGKISINFSLKN